MDILGEEVLGYEDDYDVSGEEDEQLEGARIRVRRPVLKLPPKPGWRKRSLASGVQAPGQLLQPLPLRGEANNGVFDASNTSILFQGIPQRPFRGERLVISARQGSTSTVQLRVQTLSVGTSIQSVQVADMPIEAFGPTAFDVRMALQACQPGVLVQVQIYAVGSFGTGEQIPCAVVLFGRAIG